MRRHLEEGWEEIRDTAARLFETEPSRSPEEAFPSGFRYTVEQACLSLACLLHYERAACATSAQHLTIPCCSAWQAVIALLCVPQVLDEEWWPHAQGEA